MQNRDKQLERLSAAAKRTTVRLLVTSLLRTLSWTLPVPLIYAAAALTWVKVAQPGPVAERWVLWTLLAACAVPLVGLLVSLLRKRPELWGAQVLDRHHGLAGRISNALAFRRALVRTPLMEAALDDAIAFSRDLRPRRAAPIVPPRGLLVSFGLALAVFAISRLEVRHSVFVPAVVSNFEPLELPGDDVDLLRELAQEMEAEMADPEALTAVRRFNQLVEDIADRRLDRKEVFQRLEELEKGLLEESALSDESLSDALAGLERELRKSGLTKPAAEALEHKNLPDAEQALRELAKRLKERPKSINRAELERLRKALSEASKQSSERLSRIAEQRQRVEEQRKRLLNKKDKDQKPLSDRERQQLEQHERQLKRLDRQKQRAERGQQELSQLDRELADAARKLMDEMGEAAKHLERGAEDLQRMAKKQLSDKEKRALKKQLEELRQMLRRNKGNNQKRNEMLEKFRQMARGKKSGEGGEQGEGQGKGQQKKPGQMQLMPGGGGDVAVEVPVPGSPQAGPGPGGGQPGGDEAGAGADDNVRGERTDPKGQAVDVAAAGIDSGEGSASSEVVYGAAERGFAGSGYEKIYTDYKTVAEEVLSSDEIPPGYKSYVRRYFQLIRPRN